MTTSIFGERVALVTGAASGIGKAVAERYLSAGMGVVAVDSQPIDVGDAQSIAAFMLDVREPDQLAQAVDEAWQRFGRLDVVAAIAGVSGGSPFLKTTPAERDVILGVNLLGVWNTLQATLPRLLMSPGPRRAVVCGSLASSRTFPGAAAYATSKHGLVGLVKTLALEFAGDGITVNMVSPAAVATDMTRGKMSPAVLDQLKRTTPIARMSSPEEVAAAFGFVTSADAGYLTGENINLDGGCRAVNVHSMGLNMFEQ